ncbi:hypothetical protein [Legionella maioricensis]|uniref:Transmembrane protein n=1 Tax=Legionella maioricensis TaxID=2896528 RepID=A0A9X2CYE2_9GAMM|nr:hypothetical protein [Legionella maioricensis]MCL9682755.1 hypothetical protein [Legionella maioricensis]MCL9687197.1 hypothetical protein [Legionella maioricensis]
MTQDHQKLTCDLIHEVNHPTSEVISDPMMNIGMQVLGGFIALVGCAAVTTAFVLLNAATFGIPGLIVAGLGVAFVLGGVGLFARGTSQKNQTEPDVTIDFSEEQLPAPL